MNRLDWSKVVYKFKSLVIPNDQVKDYYYKGIELEIWLNGVLIGHTEIKQYD